ncbi:MAG: UDP-2,3-diacylglucosamine diphosphatase [Gammaproteobacteria bacterium]|nr:UDP-2,3-diacylglucosamine diphosphatase [Gammaproteobacteria bacterium]
MLEAVFISDLHLHPDMPDISKRFEDFLVWVSHRTRALYILGDFFHVWAGDDTSNAWSDAIASRLALLTKQGMQVYFMRGNRDFLLGETFFKRAGLIVLDEPALIELGGEQVMLVHGDRYCIADKAHQRFRRFTRNRWFPALFMMLPKWLRTRIVMGVRVHSETNTQKQPVMMDVVPASLTKHLKQCGAHIVVHGHTHKPGHTSHLLEGELYQQYVLSDWDASPHVLCYDDTIGFNFNLLGEGDG